MNKLTWSLLPLMMLVGAGCDLFSDLDTENENNPNLEQVFADPAEYPALLSGAYRLWWNESIGPNPGLALGVHAEVITSGYGSWGMGPYYRVPREPLANEDADDVVLNPIYGGWYSYYMALPTANAIIRGIEQEDKRVIVGDEDYTEGALAHARFLQGLILGHLALLYDRAYLITEDTDVETFDFQFTPSRDVLEYALESMDQAIAICDSNTFTDPIEMMPTVRFDNAALCRFINSNAARLLVASARTGAQTEALDWNRVLDYARNGIQSDFSVYSENGWTGMAISRDPFNVLQIESWDWIRPHQRLIHMLAPSDPAAAWPRPDNAAALGEVTSPMDQRLVTDMEYVGRHTGWNLAVAGYHVQSEYNYRRYADYLDTGLGDIPFFLAAENDLLLAEALIHTSGPNAEAAALINRTRVGRGELPALTGSESRERMLDAVMHERYIELLYTYPLLGYFDRRRTDDLREGSVVNLPVPAKELLLNGRPVYTCGPGGEC